MGSTLPPSHKIDALSSQLELLTRSMEHHEARLANATEDSRSRQDRQLQQLVDLQLEQAQEAQRRGVVFTRLISALAALITAITGGGIYWGTRAPTPQQERERVAPIVRAVSSDTAARVSAAERKVETLGEIVIEQQVVLTEGIDYLGRKLDAVSPARAPKVEAPASLTEARKKTQRLKREIAKDQLFGEPGKLEDRLEAIN